MSAQERVASASSWSDLPQKIISKIETRLDSAVDVCRLHSVCKNWHHSRNPNHKSLLCPFLPRIISNNNLPFTDRQHEPVILVARAVFLVKPRDYPPPSCGWLLTVEEITPSKLRILYPLSNDHVKHLPSNCPKFLDFTKFSVSQVDRSYGFKYQSDEVDVPDIRRVILCSRSSVMVLYGGGTLIKLSLKKGDWRFVRYSIICPFSDVISYGINNVRAIDRLGNVHVIDQKAARVVKIISPESVFDKADRIILLRSKDELCTAACIRRDYKSRFQLVIYRLDEVKPEWINVDSKNDYSRVLFLSCDWRFFLYEYDLDLCHYKRKPKKLGKEQEREKVEGDYVIYAEKSFPSSSGLYGASLCLGIDVLFFNSDDARYWNTEPHCTSTTVDVMWPPPVWFWPETCLSNSDDDEELDIQNETPCNRKDFSSFCTVDASTSYVPSIKQVSEAKFTAVRNSNTLTIQDSNQNSSIRVFQGVNVKSNLIPTLQKIWGKYGNIIEGSTIRNADIIARALESLATTVIILQSNSGHSLSKDQADYMSSALCDLQQMKFNVNWLVPFVEKAIAVHKSRPLINALKDFDKAKAQAEEMKIKVLDELAKLDEVEEDIVLVSEKLPGLKSMDFDQILGDGVC